MINLIIFITFILLTLTCFIVSILFFYQKKQIAYFETIEKLKFDHEKNTLKVQLEMQEQTLQHISREIHDNISLSLTLAKLNLNTLDWKHQSKVKNQVDSSLQQISKAITDLRDLSKGLNSDIITKQGLIEVLEKETTRFRELGLFRLDYEINGDPVFMDSQKELVIFRIIQEAINNIIKHANATAVRLTMDYASDYINVIIKDNGKGFNLANIQNGKQKESNAGLSNMQKRSALFNGSTVIESEPGIGTSINITIPY